MVNEYVDRLVKETRDNLRTQMKNDPAAYKELMKNLLIQVSIKHIFLFIHLFCFLIRDWSNLWSNKCLSDAERKMSPLLNQFNRMLLTNTESSSWQRLRDLKVKTHHQFHAKSLWTPNSSRALKIMKPQESLVAWLSSPRKEESSAHKHSMTELISFSNQLSQQLDICSSHQWEDQASEHLIL